MARRIVTAEQMREIDRVTIQERGVAGAVLMERAGRAVADVVLERYRPGRVGLIVGKGNNAGDGLVVARLLAEEGIAVKLLMLVNGENLSPDARTMYERLEALEGPAAGRIERAEKDSIKQLGEFFADCELVVDAILGTGIQGAVRGSFGEAISLLNETPQPVVSIDIPSGLEANTGKAEGACVIAERTVTLGLAKIGCVVGDGPSYAGTLHIDSIGFPEDLLEDDAIDSFLLELDDALSALPRRPHNGHKGSFGGLLVAAGSTGMNGAAWLAAETALHAGTGMVYTAFPRKVSETLETQLIEAVKAPIEGEERLDHESWESLEPWLAKADALALGPGIGTHPDTARLVDELVCQPLALVVDADGLNCLGEKHRYLTSRKLPTVLTPHPMEMARLLGIDVEAVQADRFGAARQLAKASGAVVVLKGFRSVVAEPGGRVYVNPTGNSGLAKGGTGDVLTGLIGSFLAQGCTALGAAQAGVFLHGLAGDYARARHGERYMSARNVIESLGEALLLAEEPWEVDLA